MLASSTSVTDLIVKTVSDSPQQTISGSRLSASVRNAFSDFAPETFGARNLRDFIRRFAPDIVELQKRAGTDVVYTIREKLQPSHDNVQLRSPAPEQATGFVSLLLTSPRAWKTFASPRSSYRLFVRPDGSALRVLPQQATLSDALWLRIEPISAEALLSIGKDFVETVPELYRTPLLQSLRDSKWWITYFEVLSSLGLKGRWIAFRRRRIVDEFEKALASARSQMQPLNLPGEDRPSGSFSEDQSSSEPSLARRIALAAIQRMTEQELRSLVLPLGYVIDALNK